MARSSRASDYVRLVPESVRGNIPEGAAYVTLTHRRFWPQRYARRSAASSSCVDAASITWRMRARWRIG